MDRPFGLRALSPSPRQASYDRESILHNQNIVGVDRRELEYQVKVARRVVNAAQRQIPAHADVEGGEGRLVLYIAVPLAA